MVSFSCPFWGPQFADKNGDANSGRRHFGPQIAGRITGTKMGQLWSHLSALVGGCLNIPTSFSDLLIRFVCCPMTFAVACPPAEAQRLTLSPRLPSHDGRHCFLETGLEWTLLGGAGFDQDLGVCFTRGYFSIKVSAKRF